MTSIKHISMCIYIYICSVHTHMLCIPNIYTVDTHGIRLVVWTFMLPVYNHINYTHHIWNDIVILYIYDMIIYHIYHICIYIHIHMYIYIYTAVYIYIQYIYIYTAVYIYIYILISWTMSGPSPYRRTAPVLLSSRRQLRCCRPWSCPFIRRSASQGSWRPERLSPREVIPKRIDMGET